MKMLKEIFYPIGCLVLYTYCHSNHYTKLCLFRCKVSPPGGKTLNVIFLFTALYRNTLCQLGFCRKRVIKHRRTRGLLGVMPMKDRG